MSLFPNGKQEWCSFNTIIDNIDKKIEFDKLEYLIEFSYYTDWLEGPQGGWKNVEFEIVFCLVFIYIMA